MARTTSTITFSLPPELSDRVDEALLRYLSECEWRELLEYGEQKARARGLGPEDVARLVEDYRAEAASSQQ